jgi:tetratricopeptide (TPR) repeat protein
LQWPETLRLAVVALGVLLLNLSPAPVALVEAMREGDALSTMGDRVAAVKALEMAARLDPRSPLPYVRLGQVYLDWHRWAEAGQVFRQANRRQETAEGWAGLGQSLAERQDWVRATQAWLQALRLDPGDADNYVCLAQASLAQSQFDQARQQLRRALALDPHHPRAHGLLGLLALDDPPQARVHLEQVGDPALLAWLDRIEAAWAGSSEEERAEAAVLSANLLLHLEQPTLARGHLERFLAKGRDNAEVVATLGYTLDRLGETGPARQALLRALELDPDLALGYYFLGLHERELGRWQTARDYFWEAVQREPSHAAACAELAAAQVMLHEYEAAETWYAAAVDQAPPDQELAFRLVQTSFYLDTAYKASSAGLAAAQEAAALAPDDPRALDLLGWAQVLSSQYGDAEATLQQALARAPELASGEYHLGSLYATTGRYSLARQHLERAAGLDRTGVIRSRAEALLQRLAP